MAASQGMQRGKGKIVTLANLKMRKYIMPNSVSFLYFQWLYGNLGPFLDTPYAYVPCRLHHWVEPFILDTSIKVDKLDEKTFHPSIFFCLSKLRLQNRKHVLSRPQHPVALPGHKGHTIPPTAHFIYWIVQEKKRICK